MDWTLTFILGGGPSAADVDTSRLRPGAVVLGVNDAALHKPCDAFFSNDHNYALRIRAHIEGYPGERHLSVYDRNRPLFDGWQVKLWRRVLIDTPCESPDLLASGRPGVPGCSGYVALNLAAQMGAKTIVLFGYDFDDRYTYFFNGAPYPRKEIGGVIKSFRSVAPHYAKRGIKVLNANPRSRVDAFEKITHEAAYALALPV